MSLIKPKWPRKQRLAEFAKNNFTDPERELPRLRRQLKKGELPGELEGKLWFVWILPDGQPAYGYSESTPEKPKSKCIDQLKTGNPIADAVLLKYELKQGTELR
ncbi:hypothetical protein [Marinomonas spartinae]|uniref:hypothetical protein n=1 Tax=Marinomonas spartinae TaxID=1792290 RepID=UPI0018F1D7D9|nr:hypothetical protein [Marinomonas spartinae]MBJ7555431.1 hypothetical protein [Marinomonas spartinae]